FVLPSALVRNWRLFACGGFARSARRRSGAAVLIHSKRAQDRLQLGGGLLCLFGGHRALDDACTSIDPHLPAADFGATERYVPLPVAGAVSPPDCPGIEAPVIAFERWNQRQRPVTRGAADGRGRMQ